jgi:aspartate 4-decarboxylase
MKETFDEPCNAYYKIFVDKQDNGYKYRTLSPFEFKNTLIKLAKAKVGKTGEILNAGRGNPNFYSSIPRYAFGFLQLYATYIGNKDSGIKNIGIMPEKKGCWKKLHNLLEHNKHTNTGKFLLDALQQMKSITGFKKDTLAHQIIIAALGCFYPNPPRSQPFVEPVLAEFLSKIIYKNSSLKNKIKIFPTEGASAAIVYVFNSLTYNRLLVKGDNIGILTPIFSPYLEIPALSNYGLTQICIQANPDNDWEIPDSELAKIGNKSMKALFICNPTNPTALSLSKITTKKIAEIVKNRNPELIILADNVYAPFVDQFNSLVNDLPYNTIGVYSFSKYFGVTGWRLGAIILNNNNVIDDLLLKRVPQSVNKRYAMVNTNPQQIPFIERLVLDSRQVAEGHTAGLSTPQQLIMTLFAMHDYLDTDRSYNKTIKNLLKKRMMLLLAPLKYKIKESMLNSNYYIILDIIKASKYITNDDNFGKYLQKKKDPLEFLLLLAKEYGTVLLPAVGFAGPFWAVRVSIANLDTEKYKLIGENLKSLIINYYENYNKQYNKK